MWNITNYMRLIGNSIVPFSDAKQDLLTTSVDNNLAFKPKTSILAFKVVILFYTDHREIETFRMFFALWRNFRLVKKRGLDGICSDLKPRRFVCHAGE